MHAHPRRSSLTAFAFLPEQVEILQNSQITVSVCCWTFACLASFLHLVPLSWHSRALPSPPAWPLPLALLPVLLLSPHHRQAEEEWRGTKQSILQYMWAAQKYLALPGPRFSLCLIAPRWQGHEDNLRVPVTCCITAHEACGARTSATKKCGKSEFLGEYK